MSAFLVSQNHINAIVTFALDHDLTTLDGRAATYLLTDENMRSLKARYSDVSDWAAEACAYGFERIDLESLTNEHIKWGRAKAADIATLILKACQCYEYQACENDDYDHSQAAMFIARVNMKALALGAKEGTVYDLMPWGID